MLIIRFQCFCSIVVSFQLETLPKKHEFCEKYKISVRRIGKSFQIMKIMNSFILETIISCSTNYSFYAIEYFKPQTNKIK